MTARRTDGRADVSKTATAPQGTSSARGSNAPIHWTALILFALGLAFAPEAWAASFYGLGGLGESPGAATNTRLGGMSADGAELVGSAATVSGLGAFVYGEPTRRITAIPVEAPGGLVESTAVGRVPGASSSIRHTTGFSDAFLGTRTWIETADLDAGTSNVEFVPTGGPAGIDHRPVGIGLNRRVPVNSNAGSFYWDAATSGFVSLPFAEVRAIDLAGTRIVAHSQNPNTGLESSFLWDETRGIRDLGALAGGGFSEPFSISANGRIVVGRSESARSGGTLEAYRWHPDLGMHALDPIVDGGLQSSARASSDEDTVVGDYGPIGNRQAFIWAPHLGRRDLRMHLITQYGLANELANWTLTRATEISADGRIIAGNGINPLGQPEAWVVDLDGPDIAEVRLRPIDPTSSPSLWELYLQCGDLPIAELNFGVILPEAYEPEDFFNFADCFDSSGNQQIRACTGAANLGPNVSQASFLTIPFINPINTHQRTDALYFSLLGQGGPTGQTLCRPGDDEVFLGPLAVLSGRPELVRSAFSNYNGLDINGNEIPAEALAFVLERTNPLGADFRIQPSLDDVDGTRWSVTMESDTEFGCLSFGITLTPDARSAQFADCNVAVPGGTLNERTCASGLDLGPGIDPASVRTLGPSPNLAGSGLREDTLYVYVQGQLTGTGALPQMNVRGRRADIGVFQFTDLPPSGFGLVPTLGVEGVQLLDTVWNDMTDWCDSDSANVVVYSTVSGTGFGPIGGSDDDNDGVPTSVDVCPYVPDTAQLDVGTLEMPGSSPPVPEMQPDAIGDLCQCGDVNQTATVVQNDVSVLRNALADPKLSAEVIEAHKCNSVGPSLPGVINPATGLPQDCNVSDVFALLKARQGQGPLVQPGSDFVSCPDIVQPAP